MRKPRAPGPVDDRGVNVEPVHEMVKTAPGAAHSINFLAGVVGFEAMIEGEYTQVRGHGLLLEDRAALDGFILVIGHANSGPAHAARTYFFRFVAISPHQIKSKPARKEHKSGYTLYSSPDAKNTRCYDLILCGHTWTGFLFVGQFVLRQIDRECYVGNITDVNR